MMKTRDNILLGMFNTKKQTSGILKRRYRLLNFAICLFVSFLGTQTFALPSGVLVPLKDSKDVDKKLEGTLNKYLASTLAKRVTLVSSTQTKKALKDAGCEGISCLKSAIKVAQRSQARFVLIPSLENEFDIYAIKLSLGDADYPNQPLVQLESSCEFCSEDDLKKKLGSMLSSADIKKALSKEGKPKGPSTFKLAVITSPPNAKIFLNGKAQGRSPLNVAKLKPQTYELEVRLKGYVSQKKTFTPPSPLPETPLSESFTLKPKAPTSFPIIVKTKPKGAAVVLDGVKIKVKSPFKARVKPGAHEISFSLKGYEDLKQSFTTPPQSETITISVSLKKLPAKPAVVQAPKIAKKDVKPVIQATPTMPPRPPILTSNWHYASLGAGVIMTGIGGFLLSLDGEITCNNGETRKTCPEIFNTKTPAAVLLSTGTAALGAGLITLLIRAEWPAASRTKSQINTANLVPTIMPNSDGASASWQFSF